MYHDSHSLLMARKIERQINENRHKHSRAWREHLGPGKKETKIKFKLPGFFSGILRIRPRRTETA